jgi:hypothetical protein
MSTQLEQYVQTLRSDRWARLDQLSQSKEANDTSLDVEAQGF